MPKQHFYFSTSLSYTECEDLYLHHIKYIVVTASNGKRVQLPKENLKKFIRPEGLKGSFEMIIDANNKILSINRIA